MKKIILLASALLLNTQPVMAQAPMQESTIVQQQNPMWEHIHYLQQQWAHIKYQVIDKDQKLDAIHRLEEHAEKVTNAFPNSAEPKIWEAIILSTDAGIVKGLSALSKVEKAKELLEESLMQDAKAMDGSAHTSLGSLYYQVPGWPIAFGDDEKAEEHLKYALTVNPNGIDPNFFYGDFLLQDDRLNEARYYLEKALQAPARPDRPLADAGRRQEIKAALAKIYGKSDDKKKKKPDYN